MQPEPSLVLSQLSQRQQSSLSNTGSLSLARQASPPPQNGPSANQAPLETFSKAPEPSQAHVVPPQAADSQVSGTQHRQIKTQKRRIAPTSKVSVLWIITSLWFHHKYFKKCFPLNSVSAFFVLYERTLWIQFINLPNIVKQKIIILVIVELWCKRQCFMWI